MTRRNSKPSGSKRQDKTSHSQPPANTQPMFSDLSRSSPVAEQTGSRIKPEHLQSYVEYFQILRNIARRIEKPKWERIKALRLSTKEMLRTTTFSDSDTSP